MMLVRNRVQGKPNYFRLSFITAVLMIGSSCGLVTKPKVRIPNPTGLPNRGVGTNRQSIEVPGVGKVNYTIHVPRSYDPKDDVPLILVLHYGYDGPTPKPFTGGEMIDTFRSGLGNRAILLAPDVVGGDWTDPQNELAAVWLAKCATRTFTIDPKRIWVTGYSMGGQGAWWIADRHQDFFTGAIPVAGVLADEKNPWEIPVFVIHSQADQVVSFSGVKQHVESLRSQGAAVEFKELSKPTHYQTSEYARYVGDGVKWLDRQAQLVREKKPNDETASQNAPGVPFGKGGG